MPNDGDDRWTESQRRLLEESRKSQSDVCPLCTFLAQFEGEPITGMDAVALYAAGYFERDKLPEPISLCERHRTDFMARLDYFERMYKESRRSDA
jgi:hypothetical protein